MALLLQDGTPLLLQNGEELLLQSDNLVVLGPNDQTVGDEQFATFEVIVSSGDPGSVTYQWYEETAGLLVGETTSVLTFIADYTTDNGLVYYCIVTDSSGTIESAHATLTVTQKQLVWLTEPQDVSVVEGIDAVFTATADGHPTVTYQWVEDGIGPIVGETGTSLTINTVIADDGKGYYCEATDGYGVVWTSATGVLTVVPEQGLAKHDMRMKTPDGQWIEVINHDFWGGRHVDTSGTAPVAWDSVLWVEERNRWELASEAGGPLNRVLDLEAFDAQNTGSTWVEVDRIPVPEGVTYDFKIEATAKQTGVNDEFFYGWYGGVVTRDTGNASFIQNLETIMQKTTDNQTGVRISIDGSDFIIEVKSRASTTWDWKFLLKVKLLWEF